MCFWDTPTWSQLSARRPRALGNAHRAVAERWIPLLLHLAIKAVNVDVDHCPATVWSRPSGRHMMCVLSVTTFGMPSVPLPAPAWSSSSLVQLQRSDQESRSLFFRLYCSMWFYFPTVLACTVVLRPSAMTCLVLPQIHQENQFLVRPKPGNIYFSFSLVVRTEA